MRILTALLLGLILCAWPARAQAAVALVQSATNATTPFTGDGIAEVTLAGNTTIGNLILVGFHIEANSRTVSGVSAGGAALTLCTQGGQDATVEFTTPREIWVFCGVATSATTAVSVTLSSAFAGAGAVWVAEFSGQHATFASAIEDVAIGQNGAAIGTKPTGNVTTASAGSAIAGFIGGSSGTYVQDATFTTFTSALVANGVAGYDLVDAVTVAYTPETSTTEDTVQVAIAIAPAGGGGGGGSSQKRRLMGLLP